MTEFLIWYSIPLLALALDRLLGEPKHWHPLVGLGNFANVIETSLNQSQFNPRVRQLFGVLAVALILFVIISVLIFLQQFQWNYLLSVLIVYLCIGAKSLEQHVQAVSQALTDNDLSQSRHELQKIVSRDTQAMDEAQVVKASIETSLENGNDAIFAVLFFYALVGIPGVVAYRIINTLDAMWGYKTERFKCFGWAAARCDDVMNWVPARLTALAFVFQGSSFRVLRCWFMQAAKCASPNGGVVMSAGAGALGVCIGGAAVYHGQIKYKPVIGAGREPVLSDIARTLRLIQITTAIWLAYLFVFYLFVKL
ncbi:MAG: adenosylcobinamide-phosphate synthase CbiB [Gammaproteobacteria bacterium]|nr:adenosylcobinamide-phosphate synthase CbiB [Gammaproteobacteria bacterium]